VAVLLMLAQFLLGMAVNLSGLNTYWSGQIRCEGRRSTSLKRDQDERSRDGQV
jgi:hypothetical protein